VYSHIVVPSEFQATDTFAGSVCSAPSEVGCWKSSETFDVANKSLSTVLGHAGIQVVRSGCGVDVCTTNAMIGGVSVTYIVQAARTRDGQLITSRSGTQEAEIVVNVDP